MKTFYISDGIAYRNRKMQKLALTRSDKVYLLKTTNYKDKSWLFFTQWQHDFRLLHTPQLITQ